MINIDEQVPASSGMGLKEFWKFKMMETLSTIYGSDKVNYPKLDAYLDAIIAKSHNPVAHMRNIYEETTWTVPLDDILRIVDSKKLIIGANGTFTYRQEVKMSELSELLIKWLGDRGKLKKQAIKYDAAGDVSNARKFDNLQNSAKENINSSYGVSVMPGYILFSPDSASMITSQARELISEMLWTLEKLLGSNMTFKTLNEFYSYTNEVTRIKIDETTIFKYNIKIPTVEMLTKRLKEYLACIPKEELEDIDNNKSLFLMIKNIASDPVKSVNFYYKYNLYEFLKLNPEVMGIINWIMVENKEFNSPDLGVMGKLDENGKPVSESYVYIKPIYELTEIFTTFLVAPIPTYDRVEKYQTRGRYIIPVSDTDSVILRLDEWVDFVESFGVVKFDTFYDEGAMFRAANVMSFICTEICNFMGRNMAKHCYVPANQRHRIEIKNEFFFKSLLLYPNIKKNYSAWTRLREGEVVNKIANTGLALTGSNVNPFVSKTLKGIISEEIHYSKDVSITRIMKRVYDLETMIRYEILTNRNVTFGNFCAYKNSSRVDAMSSAPIRGVEVWNWLYPDNIIEPYNKIYVLNTILENENQLELIKDVYMREIIRERIFKNPVDENVRKYGLRTISIPDNMTTFPEWIRDIVDVNKLVERHINSITSLLPAIGVFINRVKSNRTHISPLINL